MEENKVSSIESLSKDLTENMIVMREKFANSSDLNVREIKVNGINVSVIIIEGMVSLQVLGNLVFDPLIANNFPENTSNADLYNFIEEKTLMAVDQKSFFTFEDMFRFAMSGFVIILIDGINKGLALGAQGFNFRSISEPTNEANERGAKEGFTEPIRINMTMVRRRIKSPFLKFDLMTVGKISKTDICLMYMTNNVSKKLVTDVKNKINTMGLDMVLSSGYLAPFLGGKIKSLFSDVGITERPDTLCAKIMEGRVAIVVDGTPFALIVPYLFSENFQSIDDYCHKPYYASFIRILKYVAFFISILLPGFYVSISTFNPELFPHALLFNVVSSQEVTPFPIVIEALVIHFLYDIMREAGLRLPKPVGHAVSIVGALVIGDAAVTAGLIGSPMVLVVATTAISSFVVPHLYQAISFLRFVFIILGGIMGIYGLTLGCLVLLVNVCALDSMGVPYMSPIAPFTMYSMRDTFIRKSFKFLRKKNG